MRRRWFMPRLRLRCILSTPFLEGDAFLGSLQPQERQCAFQTQHEHACMTLTEPALVFFSVRIFATVHQVVTTTGTQAAEFKGSP